MKIDSWCPPQRMYQVADKHGLWYLQTSVTCRCLVCNQDLQVMEHEVFSGHCYSTPSLTTVCNFKWAVSSIKPPLPYSVSGWSTKHVKSALYLVLERVLLLTWWELFLSLPLPMTIYSPVCIWLLPIPSLI